MKETPNDASPHEPAETHAATSEGWQAETELKLLGSAKALKYLHEAPVIVRHARNKGVVRRLEAVYYDTPDRLLFNQGLSLRVRRSGSRYVQTLKLASPRQSSFVRQEWEIPVQSFTLDLSRLPQGDIAASLEAVNVDAILPIFTTKVRRRVQQLDWPGAQIEVAFDEGTIEAGERRQDLAEIELELKAGDPAALYELGLQLLEAAPLRVSTASKAARGYGLAFDIIPPVLKALASPLTAEHIVDDAVAALLRACQQHLLANQAAAEDGRSPDGVHQLRVALRRLRAVLGFLQSEVPSPAFRNFADEAKWLGTTLGPARNWDVFMTSTLDAPAQVAGLDVNLDELRHAAEPHRDASYAGLRETLADPRCNRLLLSFGHWIERRGWRNDIPSDALALVSEPVPALAARVLARLHHKALKRGAHFQHLKPEARHKLRIALKKLRYAAEFFLPLAADRASAKRYIARLSKLMDLLGKDNDATTTAPLLHQIGRDGGSSEVQRAMGALIGWQARDRLAVSKTLRKRWRRFKERPVFRCVAMR